MKTINIELADYWDYELYDASHPFVRAAAASCIDRSNSTLYIFGGLHDNFIPTNELIEIDLKTLTVSNTSFLNIAPRINHEMFLIDNKLYIIGGLSWTDRGSTKKYNEIIIYDLTSKTLEKVNTPNLNARFSCYNDEVHKSINYYGGLGSNPSDLNSFSIENKNCIVRKADPRITFKTGSTTIDLPNSQALIFSGFTSDQIPICHSDYILVNKHDNHLINKKCNEFVGRTFSKAVYIDRYKKAFFLLGSYNGMEICRSIIYYDIIKIHLMIYIFKVYPMTSMKGL